MSADSKKITLDLSELGTHEDAPLAQILGDVLVVAFRLEPNPYISEKVVLGPDRKPVLDEKGNPVIRESKGVIVVSTHGFKELQGAEYHDMKIRFSATGTVTKPAKEGGDSGNGTTKKKFVEL